MRVVEFVTAGQLVAVGRRGSCRSFLSRCTVSSLPGTGPTSTVGPTAAGVLSALEHWEWS
jgi:hypothetical protein